MRCYCCNKELTDFEATMRNRATGDFTDMCKKCLKGLGIHTVGRKDLEEIKQDSYEEFLENMNNLSLNDYEVDE